MSYFDIGNLITIIIVVLILAMYRQMDRNNRSLEKVKKFADKMKNQLDEFVDGKTVDLKNIGIELNVHQKTAKEILKRITHIEGDLTKRSSALEGMARRVDEYEHGLQGIVTMTGRVDENLKLLQKESEFIDTVGKRLKDAVSRMGVLEKQIPELKNEFGKQNSASLKTVGQHVVKDVRAQAERLGKIVVVSEKKMKEYAGTIRDLDVRREEMFKESITSIQTNFDEKIVEAEKAGEQILARFDSDLDHSIHVSDNNAQKLIDRIKDLHEELGRRINTSEEDIGSKLDTFQDQVNTLESQYQENLRNASKRGESLEDEIFTSLKDHVETRAREVERVLSSEIGEVRKNIEDSRGELNALFGETRSEITVWQATLQKRMEDSQLEYDNRYSEFSRNIESSLTSLAADTNANAGQQRDDLEKFINETRSGVIDFETSIRHRLDSVDEKLQQKEEAFRELMKVTMERETETAKTVVEQMNEGITAFEERVKARYQEVENKLGEYEGEVTYRFNRIDEVNLDIDRLEENLRIHMEEISENIKNDFIQFGKELNLLQEGEKTSFEKNLTTLHQSMDDLENELVELKSRAYDNVSEKLRVFEDEFFSDIRERNDSMQEKLSTWQLEIDGRMLSISESEEKQRFDLEKQYSEDLSKRIEDFSLQSTRQQEVVEQHIQEYQDRVNGQVKEMQDSMGSLKDNLFNEIEEIQGRSRESFERIFSEHQSTIESTLKKQEREIEAGLQDIDSHLEIGQRELQGLMESSRSDITLWKAEILKEMNESEGNLREGVEVFKVAIQDTVGDLKEEFSTQRMDLIENTREERDRLKEELSEITSRVGELSADLQDKSTAALENFRTDYESFLDQFQSNAQVLTVNLQEIDKKQKSFINQTRIFDRADSLKNTLNENIENLKGEITRVDAQGREIREAEKQFLKIKKLGEEVSTKFTKFLNERRRIEEMDNNFKKLITISQSVDSKLTAVTASHDGLQEIQAKIRELENLEKEVQQNYQRLENKQTLIESTTTEVDRNFQHLEELEGQINEVRASLKILPSQVSDLSARINTLSSNKENADKVVDQLGDVDKLLNNLTDRMDKLHTAREWLARTETRLDELGKQAQEQVQLLGTLLKDGAKATKAGKGAPAMNVREMVTRLAHQGWSVKEIAQATKLSRGEVELILELLPKK